jgi:hypothetical protein
MDRTQRDQAMSEIQLFRELNVEVQAIQPESPAARTRTTIEQIALALSVGLSAASAVKGFGRTVKAVDAAIAALDTTTSDSVDSVEIRLQQAALAFLEAALSKAVADGAVLIRAPNPLRRRT